MTNKINIGQALQGIGNIGVILGIAFLAVEVRESTKATRAGVIDNYQNRWVELDLSLQNAALAGAWAKAIEHPEELTTAEILQLNGYMWSFYDHLETLRIMTDLGVSIEPGHTVELVIRINAHHFFGNEYGQAWFAENRTRMHPLISNLIDSRMDAVAGQNREFIENIRTHIRE